MSDKKVEFWRDPILDNIFEEIISIFHLEGVELVRLSGITNWSKKISGKHNLNHNSLDTIIRKMKSNNVINYDYITHCPHCGETSYIIKYPEDFLTKPKLCDTCNVFYSLSPGTTLEKLKEETN